MAALLFLPVFAVLVWMESLSLRQSIEELAKAFTATFTVFFMFLASWVPRIRRVNARLPPSISSRSGERWAVAILSVAAGIAAAAGEWTGLFRHEPFKGVPLSEALLAGVVVSAGFAVVLRVALIVEHR